MALSYFYTDDGGIIIVGTDVVTGQELIDLNNKIYETPRKIRSISYQIGDFSRVTNMKVTNLEVEKLAEQDKKASELNPNMIIALVAEDDLGFGLSRMWQAYTEDLPLESMVFRTLKEAEIWMKTRLKHNHKIIR